MIQITKRKSNLHLIAVASGSNYITMLFRLQAYESPGFRRVTAIRPVYLQYLLLRGVSVRWQVLIIPNRQ